MTRKNDIPLLIAALLITVSLLGGAYWFWTQIGAKDNGNDNGIDKNPLKARMSDGKTILVPGADNEAKQFAAKAIVEGNKDQAIQLLSDYLQNHPNDPEAQIYLNNLQAQNHNPLKIALVLSIENLNIGQEMLRGAAQAQTEINQSGGINGRHLHIMIVNDGNKPEISAQVAQELSQNPEILAVAGHNASNASIAAAPFYQKGRLVMVNPTSLANGVSDTGDYIFRVVPSIGSSAKALAQIVKQQSRKISICYDSQAPDSVSFQQEFVANLLANGKQPAATICDFSSPAFDPVEEIREAVSQGADSLLLSPYIDRLNKAYEIAQANQNKLKLYGSNTLATIKTLQQSQLVQNLILVSVWSPKVQGNQTFAKAARKRWGGDVSWRTAGVYDAIYAIAAGLRDNPTRLGLQQALSSEQFSASTPNGSIRFLPNGDRAGEAVLIQVRPSPIHQTGFDFFPLSP
ncbi:MAG: ABC transporter substrate-binding protein [Cyanobacteriota bacterium]|jgi:branched-chain amino acid transport system substrate-binding protein